jgi:hypothetical protein
MLGLGDAAAYVASRTQDVTSIRPSSASASRAGTRRPHGGGLC